VCTIELVSTLKDPTSNTIELTFALSPADLDYSLFNLSSLVSCNQSGVSLSLQYQGNGTLIVYASYTLIIQ